MAYAKVNKTGCVVRKGNCQIRLDFYLESIDPRYQSPGTNPFHSHFIYLPATFTENDIRQAIDVHLPNFYKAFVVDGWDATPGGMRHGWAINTRIRPIDYSKIENTGAYNKRVKACQDAINVLTEFSYKPLGEIEGQTFPATVIYIGPAAIDRTSALAPNSYTTLDKGNPANDTGTIDYCEIYPNTTMSDVKFGTFFGSGTSWTNRDGETLGTVTAGAPDPDTFSGLDIDVSTNDIAGIYATTGKLEWATSGGAGTLMVAGDQFGTGAQTYSLIDADAVMSVYGTGETPITFQPWAIIM